jgi:hypothetical protein
MSKGAIGKSAVAGHIEIQNSALLLETQAEIRRFDRGASLPHAASFLPNSVLPTADFSLAMNRSCGMLLAICDEHFGSCNTGQMTNFIE